MPTCTSGWLRQSEVWVRLLRPLFTRRWGWKCPHRSLGYSMMVPSVEGGRLDSSAIRHSGSDGFQVCSVPSQFSSLSRWQQALCLQVGGEHYPAYHSIWCCEEYPAMPAPAEYSMRVVRKCNVASLRSAVVLMATTQALIGCSSSGGTSNPNPPTPTVIVTCPVQGCSVQTENTLQLSAAATGGLSSSFYWYINGTEGGEGNVGTISSSGLYTAPFYTPTGGSVTAKAIGSDGTTSGSVTITVTQGPTPTFLAFTNDGCSACTTYIERIFVFDVAHPDVQYQLSPNDTPSQDLYSTISPDKRTVAYIKQGTTEWLMTVPVEGGTPTVVKNWTDTHFMPNGLDWNPAGTGFVIAYMDTTLGICGLAAMPLDGSSFTPIAITDISCPANSSIYWPPASPHYLSDGRIIYTVSQETVILSADGQTQTSIGNGWDVSPSPDGTKFVTDYKEQLAVANIDGTNPQTIASGIYPAWCDGGNGNTIVFENPTDYHFYLVSAGSGQSYPSEQARLSRELIAC